MAPLMATVSPVILICMCTSLAVTADRLVCLAGGIFLIVSIAHIVIRGVFPVIIPPIIVLPVRPVAPIRGL